MRDDSQGSPPPAAAGLSRTSVALTLLAIGMLFLLAVLNAS